MEGTTKPDTYPEVHSEYSLLDGMCKIPDLLKTVKQLGMPLVALTDHGVLFGAVKFYREAKREGINPIIDLETYLSLRNMLDKDPQPDRHAAHLLLLAENNIVYKNALKIATQILAKLNTTTL